MKIIKYIFYYTIFITPCILFSQVISTEGLIIHYPFNGDNMNVAQDKFHLNKTNTKDTIGINNNDNTAVLITDNIMNNDTLCLNDEFTIISIIRNELQYTAQRDNGTRLDVWAYGSDQTFRETLSCTLTFEGNCYETIYFNDLHMNKNTWYTMVLKVDTDSVYCYLNDDFQSVKRNTLNLVFPENCNLNLPDSSYCFNKQHFYKSFVDDFRFYNRALSDQEIRDYIQSIGVLGNNDLQENSKIKIYPNPASNELILTTKEKVEDIHIYSSSGKYYNSSFVNGKIDISNLPLGTYNLQLTFKDRLGITSFIKTE